VIQKALSIGTSGLVAEATNDGLYVAVHQVAHGFTTGKVVYFTGSAWALAEANAATTLGIGLVYYIGVDNFSVCLLGLITGLSGLTAGQYYFVSDSSAGAITATEPVTVGNYSNPVLFALSTTTGMVLPFRPSQLSAATSYASLLDFLLDCEPMSPSTTYAVTWTGSVVTKESWSIAGPVLLKSIDYTYTSGHCTQEVRKVFYSDGVTVLAQSTIVYTYSGNMVMSAVLTRSI